METTKNIYGHLFDRDCKSLLDALNSAVSRLMVVDDAATKGRLSKLPDICGTTPLGAFQGRRYRSW